MNVSLVTNINLLKNQPLWMMIKEPDFQKEQKDTSRVGRVKRMSKKVNFRSASKGSRKINITFRHGGKKISFTKTQKVPKRVKIIFHSKRKRVHLKESKTIK